MNAPKTIQKKPKKTLPKPSGTAVERVIGHIMNGLRTGEYVPGQRLAETDLSTETGIGRSPVREALRILSGEGVISLIPNQGARLREMTATDFANFINATAALMEVGLDLAIDALDSPQNEKRVREAYEAIGNIPAEQRIYDFNYAMYEFHLMLHDITGNIYLNKFMRRLHFERMIKEVERSTTREDLKKFRIRYDNLFQALMKKDKEEVRRIWNEQSLDILKIKTQ